MLSQLAAVNIIDIGSSLLQPSQRDALPARAGRLHLPATTHRVVFAIATLPIVPRTKNAQM